ncbi:type II secretion system protein GspL [Photobacterium atrarenae]|uniref:Type II secretion system protein L n=1 Tax=Photobacterium atrarenae TaxID=865757 RepID=A0ABY5GH07_9GAMM|nr:type II secretion system protein GspL [Photobacterium atrarenae]UTV27628.1 type II secretion system protein GspL [Photobacterium atrarenae]
MSEFLTIRLSSRPEQPVQWLVWSRQQKEVIASGQLASLDQLSELEEYAAQRPVFALIPASDVLLTEVVIPSGSGRQLATVLPYLLEEELAQDVDALHVHLLKREGQTAHVAVVEHRKVQSWLAALSEAGMDVKKLVPDCLCLPLFKDSYTAAELEEQWLIRQSETQGICAEPAWLGAWLLAQKAPIMADVAEADENADSEAAVTRAVQPVETGEAVDAASVLIRHYTPAPAGVPGQWQAETPELVMQLLALGADDSGVNLLSGPYKLQPAWRKYLKPWRKVAIAAGLVLVAMVAEHLVSIQQMEQQALAYKAESERIFRQVLPQFKRIPSQSYLKRQMNSELARLGGSGDGEGLLPWLAQLQPALSQVPQLNILNVKYDQNRSELRLQASGAEFQHFEQLRLLLTEQFDVQQGQLNKVENQVTGAVVLRRKS